MVVRFSAEVEYRAMTLATCVLIWLKQLLQELRFEKDGQMTLVCDNCRKQNKRIGGINSLYFFIDPL